MSQRRLLFDDGADAFLRSELPADSDVTLQARKDPKHPANLAYWHGHHLGMSGKPEPDYAAIADPDVRDATRHGYRFGMQCRPLRAPDPDRQRRRFK